VTLSRRHPNLYRRLAEADLAPSHIAETVRADTALRVAGRRRGTSRTRQDAISPGPGAGAEPGVPFLDQPMAAVMLGRWGLRADRPTMAVVDEVKKLPSARRTCAVAAWLWASALLVAVAAGAADAAGRIVSKAHPCGGDA